jgi:hypothetical protein
MIYVLTYPDQASMHAHLEAKFDEYVYEITAFKKNASAFEPDLNT